MNHTPGPWKVGEETVFHADLGRGEIFALPIEEDRADEPFAKEICFVLEGADTNSEGDARLIAAAPELLRLLDEFRNATKHIALKHFRHSADHRYFGDIYHEASELIASLGGELIIGGCS